MNKWLIALLVTILGIGTTCIIILAGPHDVNTSALHRDKLSSGRRDSAQPAHTYNPFTDTRAEREIVKESENPVSSGIDSNDSIQGIDETEADDLDSSIALQRVYERIGLGDPDILEIVDQDMITDTEAFILQQLDLYPDLVKSLLDLYSELPTGWRKNSLRSMLAASDISDVEERALTELHSPEAQKRKQWLQILYSTGATTIENREALISHLPGMNQPEFIALSLYALVPLNATGEERVNVAAQLERFTHDENIVIRSSGIEAFGRWAAKSDGHFIEEAIDDESLEIRRAAVDAAYLNGIRTEQIKYKLFDVLDDVNESYVLRIKARNALLAYPNSDEERGRIDAFSQVVNTLSHGDGTPKG